jgi:vacuolar-type H+-ATPase subunit H
MRNAVKLASLVSSLLLSGALVVGCDKKDETAAPATTPPAGNAVTNAVSNATDGVSNAAKSAENSASNAVAGAKDQASSAAASATDTAKAKLAQVTEYIGQKKFDLADSALKEVEGMKSSLPQTMQDEVTSLRTQLDAAKATSGGGMTMPSLPK